MGTLYKNIGQLAGILEDQQGPLHGAKMKDLNVIEDAWILVEDGKISDYGGRDSIPSNGGFESIDLEGRMVLPSFCDSHTHLVFASTREGEFEDRINGLSYEEMANRGGGILNSVEKLRSMDEDSLFEAAKKRLANVIQSGTGAIEIKSGYGLDLDSELKMLRVIRRLKDLNWIPIKSTFLAAHAIPTEFKGNANGYLDLVVNEMLPAVASEKLADYIDIFCEDGYFSVEDTHRILEAGLNFGLRGGIVANYLHEEYMHCCERSILSSQKLLMKLENDRIVF